MLALALVARSKAFKNVTLLYEQAALISVAHLFRSFDPGEAGMGGGVSQEQPGQWSTFFSKRRSHANTACTKTVLFKKKKDEI